MKVLFRLAFLFSGRVRRDRELDEEIRSHLRMAVEDRVARGEPREEAERAVRREFGDPGRVKEVTRSMWYGQWLDRLRQDLRFGLRSLKRDPAFAWTAAVVLAVGIGANAAVFTLANGLLLEDAPGIWNPDELVGIRWMSSPAQGPERELTWGYGDYAYVRAEADAFDDVLAYMSIPTAVSTSEESGSQADAWIVSDNFFDVLGAEMALGRGFAAEEGQSPGTHPVVVIGNAFWETRFGRDPAIVGQTLPLNGMPFTIVGVAAREFRGISPIEAPPDLYVPVMMQGAIIPGSETWLERIESQRSGWLRLVGRLRAGTTVAGARANLESVQAGWHEAFSAWWNSVQLPDFRMVATSEYRLNAQNTELLQRMLGYLVAIVVAIMLIGSANVAILLLARGAARHGEIAMRTALGARRSRIFAQLVAENLIIALLGGLGGFVVAYVALEAIVGLLPYPSAQSLAPSTTVLAVSGAVTLVVTFVFGILPSLRLSNADPTWALHHTNRVSGGNLLRNVLVVGQIAGAVVLIAGAGLFVRSIVAAQSVDPGFEPDNRLVMVTNLSARGYDDSRGIAFMNQALERAGALPGVAQASVTARPPFTGRSDEGVRVPGSGSSESRFILNFSYVGPGYFETLGIPVVAGRPIVARDDAESARALVVNETTAQMLWPDERAVGKTILWQDDVWNVIGVAADANYYALGETPASQVYVPMAQRFVPYLTFVLETEVPAESLVGAMQDVIWNLDPGLTTFDIQTLRDLVDTQTASYRLLALTGGAFGIVALVLAVGGLYGVQSYFVGQRYKEIGIRMAIGANPRQVSAGILRNGMILTLIGLLLGLPIALALGRAVEGLLFGVEATDPVTFSGLAAVLLMTTVAASYIPAKRAARVEPIMVLRED